VEARTIAYAWFVSQQLTFVSRLLFFGHSQSSHNLTTSWFFLGLTTIEFPAGQKKDDFETHSL